MRLLLGSLVWQLCLVLTACTKPVGIANEGNYCFFSSLLQVLFYLPDLRGRTYELAQQEYDHAGKEPTSGLFHVASVFGRLQEPKGYSVSISGDLYRYFVQDTRLRGYNIVDGGQNDQYEAFCWIAAQLPFLETEKFLGYTLTYQRTSDKYTWNKVDEYTNVGIVHSTEDLDRYVVPNTEFEYIKHPNTGEQCLAKVERTISDPKNLLLFKLRDMDPHTYIVNAGNRNYPHILMVAGRKYELFALTIYNGGGQGGHYYSYVQTNIFTGDWHVLNDAGVTPTTLDVALKQMDNVYTVAYIASDHLDKWRASDYETLYKVKIPPSVQQHNDNYKPPAPSYSPPPSSTGGGGSSSNHSGHGNSNNNSKPPPETPTPKTPRKADDASPVSPSGTTKPNPSISPPATFSAAISQVFRAIIASQIGWWVIVCLTLLLVGGIAALVIIKVARRRRARDLTLRDDNNISGNGDAASLSIAA